MDMSPRAGPVFEHKVLVAPHCAQQQSPDPPPSSSSVAIKTTKYKKTNWNKVMIQASTKLDLVAPEAPHYEGILKHPLY